MINRIAIILVMIIGSLMVTASAEATNNQRQGLFARMAEARQQRQRQRVIENDNHHQQSVVQRQIIIQNNRRSLRIVEVPNLHVRQGSLIIIRDHHGNILDVRRQNVVNVERFRSSSQNRAVQQNRSGNSGNRSNVQRNTNNRRGY